MYNQRQGRAYLFTPPHGSPSISLDSLTHINDVTPNVTGTASDAQGENIDGVQWSFDNSLPGTWRDCTASDGTFNSSSEEFSCNIHGSDLDEGGQTVYLRTKNDNGVYIPVAQYSSIGFNVDTTPPSSFELVSPDNEGYINSERPIFKWKPASIPDANSGLSKYKLEIDNGGPGDFIVDNIHVSQPTDYSTSKYVVHYQDFDDSDPSNNYISIYTNPSPDWHFSENEGRLKEGKRTWKVTAVDKAGNIREVSRVLHADFTPPSIPIVTSINLKSFNYSQAIQYCPITQPAFRGTGEANSTILITINSETIQGTTTTDSLGVWEYTPSTSLALGGHEVSLKAKDKAGNESDVLGFSLNIGSSEEEQEETITEETTTQKETTTGETVEKEEIGEEVGEEEPIKEKGGESKEEVLEKPKPEFKTTEEPTKEKRVEETSKKISSFFSPLTIFIISFLLLIFLLFLIIYFPFLRKEEEEREEEKKGGEVGEGREVGEGGENTRQYFDS